MMLYPPIDKLVEKVDCKYALVSLITKRARFLLDKKPEMIEASGKRVVTYVAEEIMQDKIFAKEED